MLRTAAASIAKAAGWITPAPDAAGVITFRLAEGLRLELFSPDGRTVILCGTVCSLPHEESEADVLVEKALRFAAAGGHRRSVLSLTPASPQVQPPAALTEAGNATAQEPRKLLLHRVLQGIEQKMHKEEFFASEAEGLLNDLAWWRSRLGDDVQRAHAAALLDGGVGALASLGFPPSYFGGPLR